MRPHCLAPALLFSLLALAACGSSADQPALAAADSQTPMVGEVLVVAPAPMFTRASTPNLVTDAAGHAYLTFTEQVDSATSALRFAQWTAGSWGEARDIVRGRDLFVNWADFPSLVVLENGDLAAHWLEREGDGTYAYGVRVARSEDGGAHWSAGVAPHTDGLLAEHGFVSLWAAGGDGVGAVWLDGRKTAMPDSAREMTLRTTVLTRGGTAVPEQGVEPGVERLLDSRICDCCQTASAATRRGRVVVYRDRSMEEIRDIAIVREEGGAWSAPALVHADNWHFEACPVNGPSVAAAGDTVAVAWFTGAQDTARVRLAISTDGGATFGAPMRIDEGDPLGRVTVLLDTQARPVVLWMERVSADSSEVRVRRVSLIGEQSPHTVVTTVSASRRSGFPRMVRADSMLLFAWTEAGTDPQVRVGSAMLVP